MSGNPVITTRKITEADLPLIMEWRMRPDITKYMNTDPVLTLEGQKKWFSKISNDNTCRYWMVEIDGELSGVVNLADIDYEKKSTSAGYYIGNLKKRDLSVALDLECALYDYVFFVLNFDVYKSEIFALNKGVIQLHKMCGSRIDYVAENEVTKNGQSFDIVHMIITKEEWLHREECKKNLQILTQKYY